LFVRKKSDDVLAALMEAGFPAVTRMISVVGRGKQRGIKIGEITYDEIPKEMLLTVVESKDKDFVIKTIMHGGKTGEKGAFGDGKIFISPVEETYTISSGIKTKAGWKPGRGEDMKEIMAVIRMNKMNQTKKALIGCGHFFHDRHGSFGPGQGPC
jgi:nitrogen regulatory protein PII 1